MFLELTGLIFGIASASLFWREAAILPRKARREILDELREPPADGLWWGREMRSRQERIDMVVRAGTDPGDLERRFSMPRRHLWRAVRKLYDDKRIEVFLLEGPPDDHPGVPKGTRGVLPVFVRGALPPDLRPDREKVEKVLMPLH